MPFMTSKKRQFVSALMVSKFYGFLPNKVRISAISPCTFSLLDGKDGLPILVEKMGSESRFLDCHLPSQKAEVGEFMICKFKVSCGIEVSNALEGLGLELPFFGEGVVWQRWWIPLGVRTYIFQVSSRSP